MSDNPIHLLCPSCGAPARYDVSQRVYHCAACGTDLSPGEQLKRVETWRSISHSKIKASAKNQERVVYECPGCGASVVIEANEAAGSCSFCGGSLVRKDYKGDAAFPEMIIPFRIKEEEAKEKLRSWIKQHGTLKEKQEVKKHAEELKGYYLPYQFVRGPIECTVSRDMSQRFYHCGGYIDSIAVSSSKQLNNEILDAAEPFDWEECREFQFGYIAGYRVKLQDIAGEELRTRVKDEVTNDYLPVIEKAMHTKGITVLAQDTELEERPILLPMYVIRRPSFTAVVNGETGAVAVSLHRYRDRSSNWFIEPLLTTVILTAVSFFFFRSIELAFYVMLAVGAVSFVAFGQERSSHPGLEVHAENAGVKKGANHPVPVFREKADGEMHNVTVRFFPLSRILFFAIAIILFNVMPLLIAMGIQLLNHRPLEALHVSYIGLWLVISIPFTFIFWIAYLRRDIYDAPVIYDTETGKRLKAERKPNDFLGAMKEIAKEALSGEIFAALLLYGLPAIMFIMSVYLILTG